MIGKVFVHGRTTCAEDLRLTDGLRRYLLGSHTRCAKTGEDICVGFAGGNEVKRVAGTKGIRMLLD